MEGDDSPSGIRSPLLACALVLNFLEYVALRLMKYRKQNPEVGKKAATFMHRYLKDIRMRGLDMAMMLVKQGADVNVLDKKDSNVTVWGSMLADRLQINGFNPIIDLDPILPQFISTALARGADPNASIGWQEESLAEVVQHKTFPHYPTEAKQLQEDIKKAVKNPKRGSNFVEIEGMQSGSESATTIQQPMMPKQKRLRPH